MRSCRWLIAPMSSVSIVRISRRVWAACARRSRSFPLSVIGPARMTAPAWRTSRMVPISAPHSVRSMTAISGGVARPLTWLSSIHTKSAP